jgi:hypothetical protein
MSAPKPPGDDLAWKLIFAALFADAEAQLETEKEVGQLARTINGVVEVDEAALPRLRELMPFPELNRYNALEGADARVRRQTRPVDESRLPPHYGARAVLCRRTGVGGLLPPVGVHLLRAQADETPDEDAASGAVHAAGERHLPLR